MTDYIEIVEELEEMGEEKALRWMVMEHYPASIMFFERGIDENGGTIL